MINQKFNRKIEAIFSIIVLIILIMNNTSNLLQNSQGNKLVEKTNACEIEEKNEMLILLNKTIGDGTEYLTGKSIVKSTAGKYAVSGWTNSSGAGDMDVFVIGLDSNGNQEWNRTIGDVEEDKGYQIIVCDSGGYVVVSTFTNDSLALHTFTDIMVTKIADNGDIIWNNFYGGPEQTGGSYSGDLGRSIVQCSNGDFVIGGVTVTTAGNCDYWMFRISSSGIKIWDRTYHNWDIDRCYTPHSLLQCNDGGFAIVGYTYNSTQSNDVWLIRTNSFGIPLWNKTFGDSGGYQRPEGLFEISGGGFIIIANTHSFGAGGSDAWVIRTDLMGNQIWNATFGGTLEDSGYSIMEMPNGEITFVGSTHSFDQGNGDAWIVRMNENGTLLWNFTIGDPYGNSAGSFVYDGSETYTVLGSTIGIGDQFGKMWILRLKLNTTIITLTPTNTTTVESDINLPSIIIGSLFAIAITKIRRKRR